METLAYLLLFVAARLWRRGRREQALLYTLLSLLLIPPILDLRCAAETPADLALCAYAHIQLLIASDLIYWIARRFHILDLIQH